jgi:hypothetical protein
MSESARVEPEYGNWVSARILYALGALTLFFAGLSLLLPRLVLFAGVFCLSFAYFAYAHYRFSPEGGNIQAKIRGLVLDYLDWNGEGEAIDIGWHSYQV